MVVLLILRNCEVVVQRFWLVLLICLCFLQLPPLTNSHPPPSPYACVRVFFCKVVGDLGQTNHSAQTVAHMMMEDDISAILHAGDLSYADCEVRCCRQSLHCFASILTCSSH